MSRSLRTGQILVGLASFSATALCANSTLFHGGTIITFDEASQLPVALHGSSLLVTGDSIAKIFESSDNVTLPTGTEIIDVAGKIVSPGFIDTHRHSWQTASAYKTLGSNTTLAEYFGRYGEFTQAGTVFRPEDIYYGTLAGLYEPLDAGVTTILEHAHGTFSNETSNAYLEAVIDSGVRMAFCYAFHELSNGFSFEEQLANFADLMKNERLNSQDLVQIGIAYDAFIQDNNNTRAIVNLVNSKNVSALTMHFLGGPWGNTNSPSKLDQLGLLNGTTPVVFSHASYVTTDDAELLRKHDQYISTTPESEMHFKPASGYRALYLGNWNVPRNSPMSANQAFTLATRSGALALRRPDLGVLATGNKADIVVFDGDSPNMLGWSDPVAAVILHSHVGDIRHVMVGGEWRKRDGQLVTKQNRTEVQTKFLDSAKRIQKIWLETPLPEMDGEFNGMSNVDYVDAYTIDAVRGNGTGY
ncbi:Metallo-dependent hydrolase [Aureobasidium subglaciale]|nr:Metallo-dependent hydrolase [Aureobasidium subglaciale]KAI5217562.1 Metallo-dependent hydrolase [Aureobasidium subglaciale]KAI5225367.1 Metallo-dependent hydrolase [Aureobasidium subglaciale]KAI5255083.1 Metallo-dependent hydrolase [Aureobasidium subglaciale]